MLYLMEVTGRCAEGAFLSDVSSGRWVAARSEASMFALVCSVVPQMLLLVSISIMQLRVSARLVGCRII